MLLTRVTVQVLEISSVRVDACFLHSCTCNGAFF